MRCFRQIQIHQKATTKLTWKKWMSSWIIKRKSTKKKQLWLAILTNPQENYVESQENYVESGPFHHKNSSLKFIVCLEIISSSQGCRPKLFVWHHKQNRKGRRHNLWVRHSDKACNQELNLSTIHLTKTHQMFQLCFNIVVNSSLPPIPKLSNETTNNYMQPIIL